MPDRNVIELPKYLADIDERRTLDLKLSDGSVVRFLPAELWPDAAFEPEKWPETFKALFGKDWPRLVKELGGEMRATAALKDLNERRDDLTSPEA